MPSASSERYTIGRQLLGHEIRARRTALGLTMKQLAEAASLSFDTIYSLERGRKLPSLPALDAVALALETSAVDLLRDVFPWSGQAAPASTD